MWPRCPIKLNKKAFKKLAQPEDFQRYEYFLMKSYVDNTKNLSWCPNPSCANLALCTEDVRRPAELVRCTCGHQFCFACGMENHNPVTCDQLSKWQQRNSDDQESIRLVMATSKPCFHCGIPTTRVDGCNHMTCRKEKGGCGGDWCWMCRGDWKSHGEHTGGYYSCNKYDNSSARDLDDEASKMKQEADRYLHYFNRYFLHETAGKSVPQLRLKALEKQQQYREQTSGNPDFLIEAVDLLAKCRHILKYTYVYGFYLPDGSRGKDFFEYLQANAEGITERLSDQVNSPISKLDVTSFKNIIRVTSKYIDNMVKGIEDGLGVEGLGKSDGKRQVVDTVAVSSSRKK
jgi:ariadne-1